MFSRNSKIDPLLAFSPRELVHVLFVRTLYDP
jgi:hypothetical protein